MKCAIMRGIPGSGKTTYARQFLQGSTFSADRFFEELGYFDAKLLNEAHRKCYLGFCTAVKEQVEDIIVDNTNLSPAEIAPYYLLAQANGYDVRIINIIEDFKVCQRRQVHGVPTDKLWLMWQQMNSERLPPWWKVEVVV